MAQNEDAIKEKVTVKRKAERKGRKLPGKELLWDDE